MSTSVVIEYPTLNGMLITAEFDGTQVAKHYRDNYLFTSLGKAYEEAGKDKQLLDMAEFIFASLNQAIKRNYSSQEIALKEVEIWNTDGRAIIVGR